MAKQTNSTKSPKQTYKRFYRPTKGRMVAGVASGIARYFDNIDPFIIRIAFIAIAIIDGPSFILYALLWIIMPSEASLSEVASKEAVKENATEIKEKAEEYAQSAEVIVAKGDNKLWIGLLIIIFGVSILLKNFGLFHWMNFSDLWPVLLIVMGISLIIKNKK